MNRGAGRIRAFLPVMVVLTGGILSIILFALPTTPSETAVSRAQTRAEEVVAVYHRCLEEEPRDTPLRGPDLFEKISREIDRLCEADEWWLARQAINQQYPSRWTDEQVLAVQQLMGGHEELQENIRALVRLGQPVCRLDLSQGHFVTMGHMRYFIDMFAIMQGFARAKTERGEQKEAVDDYITALSLQRLVACEPVLYSYFLRFCIVSSIFLDMFNVVPAEYWQEQQFYEALRALDGWDCPHTLQDFLAIEADFWLKLIANPGENNRSLILLLDDSSDAADEVVQSPGEMAADMAAYARLTERLVLLAEQPYYEVIPEIAAVEAESKNEHLAGRWTRKLMPYMLTLQRDFAYIRSYVDLQRITLAVELYRCQNGTYPSFLDEVAPFFEDGLPTVSLDGAAFEYELSGNQFTITSKAMKDWKPTGPARLVKVVP